MPECRLANGRERVKVPLRMKLLFLLLGHLLVTLARLASPGGVRAVDGGIALRQASTANHEAFAATLPQSELVGSAAAWILHAFGFAEAAAQNGRDNRAFDAAAPSPCFGEVQIS